MLKCINLLSSGFSISWSPISRCGSPIRTFPDNLDLCHVSPTDGRLKLVLGFSLWTYPITRLRDSWFHEHWYPDTYQDFCLAWEGLNPVHLLSDLMDVMYFSLDLMVQIHPPCKLTICSLDVKYSTSRFLRPIRWLLCSLLNLHTSSCTWKSSKFSKGSTFIFLLCELYDRNSSPTCMKRCLTWA